MPDPNPSRPTSKKILWSIAGIYICQTMITSMTTQGLPSLMRSEGASLQLAGLTALFWLPWGLRFLWAPLIERWRLPAGRLERRSRRIVLAGQWLIVIFLAGLGLVSLFGQVSLVMHADWLLGCLILMAFVAASADVACDGFTVEQLAVQQYGWGNVAQVGGSYVGAMLGTGGFILIAGMLGWQVALVIAGAAILLLSMPMLLTQEPPRDRTADTTHKPGLKHALSRPQIRIGLLLLLLSSAGIRLTLGMFGPFMLDHGMSLEQVGWLFSSLYIGAGLFGTVIGGFMTRWLTGWRAVWVAVALKAATLLALTFAATSTASTTLLTALLCLLFVVLGCFWVTLYSALMGLTSPLQSGLDFTVFQSADALLAAGGGVVGGWLAQYLGFQVCFATAGVLGLVAAVVVWQYAQQEDMSRGGITNVT